MGQQLDQLTEAQRVVIEALGRAMALYGLPVALGRAYALLYLAETPLSFKEITDRLGITKGTASVNLRMLERLRLVRQVWTPGRRGKFYVAEGDYRQVLAELMRTTVASEMGIMTSALEESDRLLQSAETGPEATAREQAGAFRARVAALREHYETSCRLLQSLVDAISTNRTGTSSA
ncbi:MAG: ArsR family transcriptional regulator [Chloroflexota bacterium]|nr:MAG: ArsR family transcriptional regulator [Chloroflexota bacterium]